MHAGCDSGAGNCWLHILHARQPPQWWRPNPAGKQLSASQILPCCIKSHPSSGVTVSIYSKQSPRSQISKWTCALITLVWSDLCTHYLIKWISVLITLFTEVATVDTQKQNELLGFIHWPIHIIHAPRIEKLTGSPNKPQSLCSPLHQELLLILNHDITLPPPQIDVLRFSHWTLKVCEKGLVLRAAGVAASLLLAMKDALYYKTAP